MIPEIETKTESIPALIEPPVFEDIGPVVVKTSLLPITRDYRQKEQAGQKLTYKFVPTHPAALNKNLDFQSLKLVVIHPEKRLSDLNEHFTPVFYSEDSKLERI